ncbi:uncharacterized protein LOC113775392 [Coffea eugenioides]|uniref:uncharacterized protein LOC113775392 n=1 Tax=Coffea eugenioides TaxID=49369 RepID=UPI000F60472E|nr:uncharacterized protein LOC113775392 [Coffea eugenioides]
MSSSSSSGEEDGDAEWKAAIHSVSVAAATAPAPAPAPAPLSSSTPHHQEVDNPKSHNLKHYQLKAQKILNDIMEKTIEVVSSTDLFPDEDAANSGGGIQLFKHAPTGIVFDHVDEVQPPNKKPRILPGEEIDEKSKKFKRQLQSVAVDGIDILAAARDAGQKALAKLEAREAAAKAAAKREEERVTGLKKVRGERWLPSMAKNRHMGFQGC